MQIQISVYINKEQADKLEKEENKSQVVRDALDMYYKSKQRKEAKTER